MSNQARQISIFINGDEVNTTLKSIAAEQRKLNNEIANTVFGSAEYQAKVAELNKVNAVLQEHKKNITAVKNETESLGQKYNRLKQELLETAKGTDEYANKVTELKRINTILREQKEELEGVKQGYSLTKKGLDSVIGIAAGAFAVDTIISYGKELFNTAVRLDSVEKKARTVFGEALPGITRAAEENAAAMGLTNAEYLQAASNIQDLLVPMGFQRQQAADITEQLVNLSGALSEWSGGQRTSKEVSETLSKALLGERDELKGLGISISQADLDARLLADGLNKLTGNSLKQAEAATTLKLIMEQSTDAQNQYAQGTGSLARQQAEAAAKLANIGEKLSTLLLPVFNGLLDLAGDLGDGLLGVVEGIDGLINPAKAATKAFDDQAATVEDLTTNISPLLSRYDELTGKANLSKKEQDELQSIITKVADVIPTAIQGFGKYGEALGLNTEAARQFIEVEKARLQFVNKTAIEETQKQLTEAERRAKIASDILNKGERFKVASSVTGITSNAGEVQKLTAAEIAALQEEGKALQQIVTGASSELKRLRGELIDTGKTSSTVTGDPAAPPKPDPGVQDKLKKQLEDLFEKTASLRADLLAKQQDDELALTIHGIEKKYESELSLATDLEKKGVKAATAQRVALEELKQQEVGKAVADYTKKSVEETEKQAKEAAKKKAEDEIKTAKETAEFIADQEAKRKKSEADIKAFESDATLSDVDQQLAQLDTQYAALIAQADGYFLNRLALEAAYQVKKQKIIADSVAVQKKYDTDLAKSEEDLQIAKANAIATGASTIAGLFAEGNEVAKALFLVEKIASVVSIVLSLQKEKAAIYAAARLGTIFDPTGVAALALAAPQVAAANIRAGLGIAAVAATTIKEFTPPKTKQKYTGGPLRVTGADDGYTYNATFLGSPDTGMLPGYPVLLHSRATGGPVLASERGAEYFVAAHDLTNPSVMRHVRMIENITGAARGGIQQFADGGVVTPTTSTTPVANPQNQLDIAALNATLSLLNTLLQRGIIAVVPDQSVIGIVDRYNKINTASGGYLNS